MKALRNPTSKVISKLAAISQSELMEGFEARRQKELAMRQAVIDELKEEIEKKNANFVEESSKLQNALEETKAVNDQNIKKTEELETRFKREFDRHADAETTFSEENRKLRIDISSKIEEITKMSKRFEENKNLIERSNKEALENQKLESEQATLACNLKLQDIKIELETIRDEKIENAVALEVQPVLS